MEIRLDLFELKNICMDMAQFGALEAIKAHSPQRDEIKRREAQRWLTLLGYEAILLDQLEAEGLISKPKRKGKGTNSPLYYSKMDIQSALNSLKMSKYINK